MPWDPVRDLLSMQERLEDLFAQSPGWVPPADLCEVADRYLLVIELPGMDRAHVDISFAGDTLTVSGRRPNPEPCERYQQFERAQGQFSRAFRFAHPVDADRISADLADGVLTVTIPKTGAAGGRHIEVE
jgi:HSP20 family protein